MIEELEKENAVKTQANHYLAAAKITQVTVLIQFRNQKREFSG